MTYGFRLFVGGTLAAMLGCSAQDEALDSDAGDESGTTQPGTASAATTAGPSGGSSDNPSGSGADATGPGNDSAGTAPGDGTGASTGGPEARDGHVRFIAMGDGGEGNDGQYAVATAVEDVCSERGCEFVLYLGDNFYDVGVESTMDQQFTDKFEMPYMDLDLPFYVVLGNHDYGTISNEWHKSQYQVEYTKFSTKWTLPSEYYSFVFEHVNFIGLDTARLFWSEDTEPQRELVREVLAQNPGSITIAYGHHPYISNGQHGNAGNYEGVPLPVVAGVAIEDFFNEEICGKVTVYLSGHDHNRQWHQPTCGTEFLVSGAASKTTDFAHRDGNPAPRFEDAEREGFAWIEILDSTMTVAFYDLDGAKEFEQSIEL